MAVTCQEKILVPSQDIGALAHKATHLIIAPPALLINIVIKDVPLLQMRVLMAQASTTEKVVCLPPNGILRLGFRCGSSIGIQFPRILLITIQIQAIGANLMLGFRLAQTVLPVISTLIKSFLDLTFCGDWDGSVFGSDCPNKGSCQSYVQNNPSDFEEAYWSVNYVKVFQKS